MCEQKTDLTSKITPPSSAKMNKKCRQRGSGAEWVVEHSLAALQLFRDDWQSSPYTRVTVSQAVLLVVGQRGRSLNLVPGKAGTGGTVRGFSLPLSYTIQTG